jgi:DNA-binding helix-hairpin-helix protein with protein kinase domain
MVDSWKSCERRFTFNANQAVSDSEQAQLRSQYAAKSASLDRLLPNGAAEVQRFSKEATGKAAGLKTQSEWDAQKLAQAQTDLSAL